MKKKENQWMEEIHTRPELAGKVIAIRDGRVIGYADTRSELYKKFEGQRIMSYQVPSDPNAVRIMTFKT